MTDEDIERLADEDDERLGIDPDEWGEPYRVERIGLNELDKKDDKCSEQPDN